VNYAETVFFQRFVKALQARADTIAADTVAGVETWDAYLKNIGYISGLQEALAIASILNKEMSKE
jgi:hypothetical protein